MADKQINDLPNSPLAIGINLAGQKSQGGALSTVSVKSDDFITLIDTTASNLQSQIESQINNLDNSKLSKIDNLSDVNSIPQVRINLFINNVDNTSDIDKPTSAATQLQLNTKLDQIANLSDLSNTTAARTNIGLGSVDNTSDLDKPVSTATQTALDNLSGDINSGLASKLSKAQNLNDLQSLPQAKINLSINNVDNTSDIDKPISAATNIALSSKLSKISNLSDVSDVTQSRVNLGLGNVNNTSDLAKPISTATQSALNGKLSASSNLSDLQSISVAKQNLSINNVDNTSDINKPISTATQTALDNLANGALGSDNFQGVHDASTGSYPSLSPSKGHYWIISVAGTIGGIPFNVDDWILYLGTPVNWIKVLNSVQSFNQVNSDWNATSGIAEILNKPASTNLGTPSTLALRDGLGAINFSDNAYVSGTNPCIQVSADSSETPRTGVLLGSSSTNGAYFNESLQYDGNLRQSNISRNFLVGVGTNANIKFSVNDTKIFKLFNLTQNTPQIITAAFGTISSDFSFYLIQNTADGSYSLEPPSNSNIGRDIIIKARSVGGFPVSISGFIDGSSQTITLTPDLTNKSFPSVSFRSAGPSGWLLF